MNKLKNDKVSYLKFLIGLNDCIEDYGVGGLKRFL